MSNKLLTLATSSLLLLVLTTPVHASINLDLEQQREHFKAAEEALKDNDRLRFAALKAKLGDYPIVPYLKYDDLKKRVKNANVDVVDDFLETHKDFPFAYHLRSSWLKALARQERWEEYLQFYDGRKETTFRCLALKARLNTGKTHKINDEIKKIWMSGYSQPSECDPAFAHFLKTADNVTAAIWLRIEKAFKARRPSLARFLSKKLDDKDKRIVDRWYQAHKNPADSFAALIKHKDGMMNRKIIIHALDRLARRDSEKAQQLWHTVKGEFEFSPAQRASMQKRIALSSAYQHRPAAKELLEALPSELMNDNAYLWLARIHLRDEDWIGLIKTINAMPQRLRKEAEWSYWHARSYEEAGNQVKAASMFDQLATRGTYYGFLAADKAEKPYQIVQQHLSEYSDEANNDLLKQNPSLLRARELFFVGRNVDARREWFQGIRKLKTAQIKQAAKLAHSWKWFDSAIKTVAKTSHRTDYDLRFPMPYQEQVMDQVSNHKLDAAIVYGIMRRESLFDPLAKSRVGALGLMQLMPQTAKHVAKSIGLKRTGQYDILNVGNNIRLGTQYFRSVLDKFDNNVPLAAAAYNAGPGNVRRWLPREETLPADLWVETVPFKETRNYVQAVLAYATIFDKHLGQDVRISSRMDDVRAAY